MKKTRRAFLKDTAAGLGAPLAVLPSQHGRTTDVSGQRFKFKVGYLWLPHMSSRPFPTLFSSDLDDALVDDYRRYLPQVKEAGFEYLVIAGLIGENGPNQLPADLTQGFSRERDSQIRVVIDLIHQAGLKFLHCLGVYSWGFKNIIAAHPELASHRYTFRGITDYHRRNNSHLLDEYDRLQETEIEADPDVLNASLEQSWQWQESAVRFLLKTYPIDGFHMESADRGRCWCQDCRKIETIAYHARINERTTKLIKELAPDKIVGVNNSGLVLEGKRDLPALRQMTRGADYFMDVSEYYWTADPTPMNDQTIWFNDRPVVAREIAPAWMGQLIHHRDVGMDRSTWFTPAAQTIVQIINKSFEDGCRAQEYYALGAFNNPGKELNNYMVGYALDHPGSRWNEVLEAVVDRLYRPSSSRVRLDAVELFRATEMSWLANDVLVNMVHKSVTPVPYLYKTSLYKQMRYQRELETDLLPMARKLQPQLKDHERATRLVESITGTITTVRKSVESGLQVSS